MTAVWDKNKISTLLCEPFAPHHVIQGASDSDTPPTASVDVLITFDPRGVSSHPNHISLYHGARTFISTLMRGKKGWDSPVDLYTLTSISIFRKYISFWDAFVTLCIWATSVGAKESKHPSRLLFFTSPVGEKGLPTAWRAMTTAHKSQMAWFRWGWIAFSRYMVVNDLKLERIGEI